jgi:hypothetical protein
MSIITEINKTRDEIKRLYTLFNIVNTQEAIDKLSYDITNEEKKLENLYKIARNSV